MSGRSSQAGRLSKEGNLKDGPNKVKRDPKDVLEKDQCVDEGSLNEDGKRILPKKTLRTSATLEDKSNLKGDEVADRHNLQDEEFLKDEHGL